MIEVFLEVGSKRVFAGALAWPGWCRGARDAGGALEALLAYAPRYARAIARARQRFGIPTSVSAFRVIEQLPGNATTDFGAPGMIPAADDEPLTPAELRRITRLLQASWAAFDSAAEQHATASLRTGPRGGGRTVVKMMAHVLEADALYATQLGAKRPIGDRTVSERLAAVHAAFAGALAARAAGAIPDRGPRGGARWPARYAARRSAWHALDHAWEIEDRAR